jgi:hypothetical protein
MCGTPYCKAFQTNINVPWISLLQLILNVAGLNQSGAGIIRNCTKPPPGIKLGIKVDYHGYQKNIQILDFDI